MAEVMSTVFSVVFLGFLVVSMVGLTLLMGAMFYSWIRSILMGESDV